jgi:hypothetical protein
MFFIFCLYGVAGVKIYTFSWNRLPDSNRVKIMTIWHMTLCILVDDGSGKCPLKQMRSIHTSYLRLKFQALLIILSFFSSLFLAAPT